VTDLVDQGAPRYSGEAPLPIEGAHLPTSILNSIETVLCDPSGNPRAGHRDLVEALRARIIDRRRAYQDAMVANQQRQRVREAVDLAKVAEANMAAAIAEAERTKAAVAALEKVP
jgi:hypothetical protein